MIAATYDGLIRKRNSFLIFGLISGVLLGMAGSTKGLSSYLYVLVCFYYNGFIKFLGSGTQWKLMWSLPLTDRQLILGKALSLMLLGFGMNGHGLAPRHPPAAHPRPAPHRRPRTAAALRAWPPCARTASAQQQARAGGAAPVPRSAPARPRTRTRTLRHRGSCSSNSRRWWSTGRPAPPWCRAPAPARARPCCWSPTVRLPL